MWRSSRYSTQEVEIPVAQRRLRAAVCFAITIFLAAPLAWDILTRDLAPRAYVILFVISLFGSAGTYVCWTRKTKHQLSAEGKLQRDKFLEDRERREHEWIARIYKVGFWIIWVFVFISSWAYCILEYGYLLGVGLGWLPSIISATVTAGLWPFISLIILIAWGIWFK
jgi:hypothetical protein